MARDRSRIVLVVEDDEALRQLYRTALMAAGFAVVGVGDGVEALRFVDQDKPAAVVLDLGLPRLNGLQVYEELAAQGLADEIPIIVVTGDTRGLDTSTFACVLRKPIDPGDLADAVLKCLRAV